MRLTVTCPLEVFYAYWYATGTIVSSEMNPESSEWTIVVDYGDDTYRAEYQAARFHSGLYFATLT